MKGQIQASQEALRRQIRRQISHGGLMPPGVTDALWLETLAQTLTEAQRRRHALRGLLIVVGAFSILPVLVATCFYPALGPFATLAFVASLWVGIARTYQMPACHEAAVRHACTVVLPRVTPESTGAVLRFADAIHGAVQDSLGGPEQTLLPSLAATDDALQRLLPRFDAPETLDGGALRALKSLIGRRPASRPELLVAALLVLADTGDRQLRDQAQFLAQHHPDERVREAAAEYVRATEGPTP